MFFGNLWSHQFIFCHILYSAVPEGFGTNKPEWYYYYLTSPFIFISHYFHVEYVIDHVASTSMALAPTKCHNYLITLCTYQNITATD